MYTSIKTAEDGESFQPLFRTLFFGAFFVIEVCRRQTGGRFYHSALAARLVVLIPCGISRGRTPFDEWINTFTRKR